MPAQDEVKTQKNSFKKQTAKRWAKAKEIMNDDNWADLMLLLNCMESPAEGNIEQILSKYRASRSLYYQICLWELISLLAEKFPANPELQEFLRQEASGTTFGKAASLIAAGAQLEVRYTSGTPYGLQNGVSLYQKEQIQK